MADDLIPRLRALARSEDGDVTLAGEAADEIERLAEQIGREADAVDNLVSAENLPLPAALAKQCRTESLLALRDRLRAITVAATGTNPWEGHHDG